MTTSRVTTSRVNAISTPTSVQALCDLSTVCLVCDTPMRQEHAHYRCPACGWRDSCCDGPY